MGIPFEPTDWSQLSKQTRGWWKNTVRTAIEVCFTAAFVTKTSASLGV
jgi:hypothetical protein